MSALIFPCSLAKRNFLGFLPLFFIGWSANLQAQPNREENDQDRLKLALARMQQHYASNDRLHLVMRIEAFESPAAARPYYHEQADIKKEAGNYWYHFGTTEMLLNQRFMIVVDKAARQLIYNHRQQQDEKAFQVSGAMNLDSLFRFYENPQYLGRKGDTDQYRITQKKGPVDQIELAIHTGSGLLTRLQYHYREGPVVAIHFLVFDAQPQFEAGMFNESHYLEANSGKVKAAVAFKNYHLSQGGTN